MHIHRARNFHFVSAQLLRHDGLFGHGSERDREKNKGEGRKDKKKDGAVGIDRRDLGNAILTALAKLKAKPYSCIYGQHRLS